MSFEQQKSKRGKSLAESRSEVDYLDSLVTSTSEYTRLALVREDLSMMRLNNKCMNNSLQRVFIWVVCILGNPQRP